MKFCKKITPNKYQVYKIEKKFEKNEATNHVLNLNKLNSDAFKTSKSFLNHLIDNIKKNKDIFYLSEDNTKYEKLKRSKNYSSKIKQIESLLNENRLDYEKYPNDYIHCLMSNHVYCSSDDKFETKKPHMKKIKFNMPFNVPQFNDDINTINENIKEDDFYHSVNVLERLTNLNWIIYSKYITYGYKCIIYINESKKQMIAAYQGIKFKFADLFPQDYISYISSLKSLIRKHLKLVIKNINECVTLSHNLNYSLSFTGYSFGAIFAQLSAFLCHKYLNRTQVKAVVFESIGLYEFLDKLNNQSNRTNLINLNDVDIRIYLSYPSFFNTINKHAGKVISPYDYCIAGKLKSCHLKECFYNESKRECTYQDNNIDPFYVCGLKSLISLQLRSLLNHFETNSFFIVDKWPTNSSITLSSKSNHSDSFKIDLIDKYLRKGLKLVFKAFETIKKNEMSDENISCYFEFRNFFNNDKKNEISHKSHCHKETNMIINPFNNASQLELLKEFFTSTDHLLEGYVELNRNYDFSKPITIVTGECGVGKSAFVAKYSRELISRREYLCFSWIDCSTVQHMKDAFTKLAANVYMYGYAYHDYVNSKKVEEIYKGFYSRFSEVVRQIGIYKIKTLIVFDNLSVFYHLKVLFEEELRRVDSYLKIIITTNHFDPERFGQDLEPHYYNIITIDRLSKDECHLILKNSEIYLKNLLNNEYGFSNFIDNVLRNEDDGKIPINKVASLRNMLKNTNYRLKTKQEILKYNEDILDFIRKDNKSALEFLSYIVYLDRANLRLSLLEHVYALVHNYDLDFKKDKSFKINFNHDIDYFLELSILIKTSDGNYLIHDVIYSEFEHAKILNFEKRLRITLTNLISLNRYFAFNSELGIFNETLYNKHFNVILSDYWKKKLKSFKPIGFFQQFELIMNEERDYEFRFKKSLKVSLAHIDKFLIQYKKKKLDQIDTRNKWMSDKFFELDQFLKDGMFYLDKQLKEIENRIQLKVEEDIGRLKEAHQVDKYADENYLDPVDYADLLKQIEERKDQAEELFKQIDGYYQKCMSSFDERKDERAVLIEEIDIFDCYVDYYNFIFKYLNSNCFSNEYPDYLNPKRLIKLVNLVKIELLDPIEAYIHRNLLYNHKVFYDEDDGLDFLELDNVKLNKSLSDSECSKVSEERFGLENNLDINLGII